ncbi:MAG: glycosyltransferase family 2 protein [bacterium]|nr:glycosyltransferase family 2 protein [bacterium]
MRPFVSIVIPVYNGAATIGRLVEELIGTLGGTYRLEVVLVNDGSRDNSEEICRQLHEAHREIVAFYSLAKNVGEHNAVMAGLNQVGGEYVVIMDDDFQNPVSEVRKLVEAIRGSDVDVIYTYYEKKQHAWWRNVGSKFNDWVATMMLGKPRDLYLSSFKVMNRFLVREVVKYDQPFPYIDGLILRTTSRIGRVAVEHHARAHGRSGYTLRKLISLWLNMFTNFSIVPLRVAMVSGSLVALVGLGIGCYTVVEKFTNPSLPVGWAMTIVLLTLFSGVQLMAMGMIGEYVGRIFLSQNKKPQYVIRAAYPRVEAGEGEHAGG